MELAPKTSGAFRPTLGVSGQSHRLADRGDEEYGRARTGGDPTAGTSHRAFGARRGAVRHRGRRLAHVRVSPISQLDPRIGAVRVRVLLGANASGSQG